MLMVQVSSLGVHQRDQLEGHREQTIAKLWNITETLNVLYRENWTLMANVEMIKFQNEMIQSIKQEMRQEGREGCSHSKEPVGHRPDTDQLFSQSVRQSVSQLNIQSVS